jgi:molecular chaperone HscB
MRLAARAAGGAARGAAGAARGARPCGAGRGVRPRGAARHALLGGSGDDGVTSRALSLRARGLSGQHAARAAGEAEEARCWSCARALARPLFCEPCGALQPPPSEVDPFAMLGLEPEFELDATALDKRYRVLAAQLHPDRFGSKCAREQTFSQAHSSALNEAYELVRDPLTRAQLLLKRQGLDALGEEAGGSGDADPAMLMRVMEAREQLEETEAREALEALLRQADSGVATTQTKLALRFKAGEMDMAAKALVELKYAMKLREEVQEKISRTYK